MSVYRDIADVIAEVGVSFTTERAGVSTGAATEYFTYTPNRQVTKPFVREHFLEAVLKSTTLVQPGDVIVTSVVGESFLCVNNTPDLFEDEIIRYLAVLYKTNVTVDILRATNTTVGYDTSMSFVAQHSAQKALLYAPLFGNVSDIDDDVGFSRGEKEELFISSVYGVQEHDRILINSTSEQYRVAAVIHRRYPGVSVVELEDDTRE
ncbi:MAG: hypothetical protein KAH38_08175 [Candidatus Hydrogenedentes bacterium]|nr:hypothetical protein [Candidatus Hydrogenedentota bacterium]